MNTEAFEMFDFFERTPDLVCIAGKDGFFRKINPSVIKKLGYTEAELFARPIASFIHPEDKEKTHITRTRMLEGKALLNFRNRYITKTGDIVWLEWTSIFIPDKEIVFAIAKDITVRKLAEREIEDKYRKYKKLTTHFKSSIEKDRKFIAFELHEQLAQLATVLKLDIDWLKGNLQQLPGDAKSKLDDASAVSELLINTIRRISFSISPAMLEESGLKESLEWYCSEFSILHDINCEFESSFDENSLSLEEKLDFFRICQQSFSNIISHAEAKNIIVRIEEIDDDIRLSISDDGKGFEPGHLQETTTLSGIRERTDSMNGHLKVYTAKGEGTCINISISKQPPAGNTLSRKE